MDGREKLRQHIDGIFEGAPHSRAAFDLRDELLANSVERYEDMLKAGMDEEAAYQSVIDSIGDVDELIAALPKDERLESEIFRQENRERSALITTVSVGLYILAGAAFFIGAAMSEYLGNDLAALIGLIVAVLICIVPTCMLVYHAKMHPKYQKRNDTVVENFKSWSNDSKKAKQVHRAVSGLLWSMTVLVYLLVSFSTNAWDISWIIFIVASCLEGAMNLIYRLWEMK